MNVMKSWGVRWVVGIGVAVILIAVVVWVAVWRQQVVRQYNAVSNLVELGAVCLYDFEYDFRVEEGRIPNYKRAPTPSPLLLFAFGKDWVAAPVYIQLTGNKIGHGEVAKLFDWVAQLPTVLHLNLRGTAVGDESIAQLASLRQLRVLDVREAAITPDGVKSLQNLMRECQILSGTAVQESVAKGQKG